MVALRDSQEAAREPGRKTQFMPHAVPKSTDRRHESMAFGLEPEIWRRPMRSSRPSPALGHRRVFDRWHYTALPGG